MVSESFGLHIIIVGVIYIIASLLFIKKSASNTFIKGWGWALFAFFHGVDEIVDGLAVYYSITGDLHVTIEKVELISFLLSSSFLLLATMIKLNWGSEKDVLKIGVILQLPISLFLMISPESVIDGINNPNISILGVTISYVTIFFGVLPTLPLALLYFIEGIRYFGQYSDLELKTSRDINLIIITSAMIILYNISEIYATTSIIALYLEVLAIIIILISPIEFKLGGQDNLSLFMIYHQTGIPISTIKFNTSISDDIFVLVTGILSAIGTLVDKELQLGELERIQTSQGLLISKSKKDFVFAILVQEVDSTIEEKFETSINISDQILNDEDITLPVSSVHNETLNVIEEKVIKTFLK